MCWCNGFDQKSLIQVSLRLTVGVDTPEKVFLERHGLKGRGDLDRVRGLKRELLIPTSIELVCHSFCLLLERLYW